MQLGLTDSLIGTGIPNSPDRDRVAMDEVDRKRS